MNSAVSKTKSITSTSNTKATPQSTSTTSVKPVSDSGNKPKAGVTTTGSNAIKKPLPSASTNPSKVADSKPKENVLKVNNQEESKEEFKSAQVTNSSSTANPMDMTKLIPMYPVTQGLTQKKLALMNNQDLKDKIKQVQRANFSKVEELAKALESFGKTELEKTWVIFYWISLNIAYDADSYFGRGKTEYSPEGVLRTGKTVCAGYASLFSALMKCYSIEVQIITGYAKGYSYKIGEKITKSNHDWNAVKIDNAWYLIDSTWGTGHLSTEGKFQREFDPYYFLSPAETFINHHLPDDEKWQLLKNPVKKAEFENSIKIQSGFFSMGLQLIEPLNPNLQIVDSTVIKLKKPSDVLLMAKVSNMEGATWITEENGITLVEVVLTTKGKYELSIFGKKESAEGSYHHMITFLINAEGSANKNKGFPTTYLNFKGCHLYEPKLKILKIGQLTKFKVKIPGAKKAAVIMDDEWNHMKEVAPATFEGQFTIKGKEPSVYAQFDDTFTGLLAYKASQ